MRRAAEPFGQRSGVLLVLLVLTVLTGLVAMHGLGPGAVPAAAHAASASSAAHAAPAHHGGTPADSADRQGCLHATEPAGKGGGHAEHADATCAATGTSGAPVLPAPALVPGGAATATAAAGGGTVPDATACGRAPPSLSELQLLRI
ncbi:DUF6153 family protein [Streptomyces sp. NPDC003042]